ncbi:hypothetical protein ABL78_4563 [Leptomonas seymouri]|uniref:Cilia- and flagella-associated protein 263 n=1 Tax=Leptomonas seymouri TaxID=5684 RepID=A0A0N0P5T9_LEPSE|nr:hypothetical protein ABL78_4563 [Leptomonas seymouri]|eukprot:KPI86377.1 hypothetical protein ABL78_4563 [Leptomonas seymouri]
MDNIESPSKRDQNRSRSASLLEADATNSTIAAEEDFNDLLISFYTRNYPSPEVFADDANELELDEINDAVTELATEVAMLREETDILGAHAQSLQQRRHGGEGGSSGPGGVSDAATDNAANSQSETGARATVTTPGPEGSSTPNLNSSGSRGPGIMSNRAGLSSSSRGRSYRRRSFGTLGSFVSVDDKAMLLRQETARLRSQEERITKEADSVQELLVATVEEAVRRQQELQLEALQFSREVVGDAEDDGPNVDAAARYQPPQETNGRKTPAAAAASATADELLRYLERRHNTQVNYLDKLEVQCQAVEQDIARAQQLVRQRRVAGEAFQAVDLEQLRIEHKQFTERMAAKNNELAELKGTSTHTVQQLNQLMGQLNDLASEQTRLKRESKSRTEYLSRCDKEYATATGEAVRAEAKHEALKAQQEAIKAPKIEEYMAQKAEEVELEKAVKNWERKVQIAEGQASVVRQRVRRMQAQRTAAVNYAKEKLQHHHQQRISMAAASKPVVGGARSLLQQRRQQQAQAQTQAEAAEAEQQQMLNAVADVPAAVVAAAEEPADPVESANM